MRLNLGGLFSYFYIVTFHIFNHRFLISLSFHKSLSRSLSEFPKLVWFSLYSACLCLISHLLQSLIHYAFMISLVCPFYFQISFNFFFVFLYREYFEKGAKHFWEIVDDMHFKNILFRDYYVHLYYTRLCTIEIKEARILKILFLTPV